MKYRISKPNKELKGVVELEGSKSITNRTLIIKALCNQYFDIHRFSGSEDSLTLVELINSSDKILRAKDGGTTFRFLLAFLAIHEGDVILTGSEQLIDRPIAPLVDAIADLGGEIEYLGKPGFPPVLVRGKLLQGNKVEVDVSMSSQFVSALLLIAPVLRNGMIIRLKGKMVSSPYIQMTLNVMKHFGIHYEWTQNIITVTHQEYSARDYTIEGDWSAASYYYAMAALADEVDLKIMNLNRISVQGDAVIARMMENFGIMTTYIDNGIRLTKSENRTRNFDYDFTNCPDLAQTMLGICAGRQIPGVIRGISTLQYKETDRMKAMAKELTKAGMELENQGEEWKLSPAIVNRGEVPEFDTHGDHRVAMSLAPLAMMHDSIIINKPSVVRKSYPGFWDDIQKLGFQLEELS